MRMVIGSSKIKCNKQAFVKYVMVTMFLTKETVYTLELGPWHGLDLNDTNRYELINHEFWSDNFIKNIFDCKHQIE